MYKYPDKEFDSWIEEVTEIVYGLAPEDTEAYVKKDFPYKDMSAELYAAWFGLRYIVLTYIFTTTKIRNLNAG